ncbi:MAG: ferritin-like protein [Flavobacteriales bacterium]|nr:ferritin-like protein [Flavobacteriales bacterium]
MKNPADWNKQDLNVHLQHALDLELWTIPLYLTALYSIKGLKNQKPKNYPDEAKLIYSVVVQEMLHLELVANLCNALGYSPKFNNPVYDDSMGIPFIHPNQDHLPEMLKGYQIAPRELCENSLKLFCAIELPHPRFDYNWEDLEQYDSIAILYDALKVGIVHLWNECYVGDDKNLNQKNSFNDYHNTDGKKHGFSQMVDSPESAVKAIDAIISQGEGADSETVPVDFRPVHDPNTEESADWFHDEMSHYQKFMALLHSADNLPPVHVQTRVSDKESSRQCIAAFETFLNEMQTHFNQPGNDLAPEFWKKMIQLSHILINEWENERCPVFS